MKPSRTYVGFSGFAAAAFFCGTAAAIELDLGNCTLQAGNETLKPTAVAKPWKMEFRAGKCRFLVGGNEVVKPKQDTGAGWTAKSDDGHYLYWLAADKDVAYLLGYQVDKDREFSGYDSPPRLRRLGLNAGAWLPDLPLFGAGVAGRRPGAVVGVLAENGKTVVLTSLLKTGSGKAQGDVVDAYEVRCFSLGATKPAWAKIFPAREERPYTGGLLWGIPPPQYAASAIQHLGWCGDRLLVCAEAMQPVLCLNGDTGSEIWRLERAWEFQRGFVGPSVWSHFIARFGVDRFDAEQTNLDKARKTFDSRYECALVAGPVAAPLGFQRGNDTHSIFLAVARGPARQWAGYLSDCIVYEFDDHGKPVSMATLPQMVQGGECSVRKDGVIWRCQDGTFVKLAAAASAPVVQMGGGGADGISQLAWLRGLSYTEPAAWFATGKARDPVVFGDSRAFCLPAGGYILRERDCVYRFPIAAVDLSTGLESEMILNVPFKGKIAVPTENYSSATLPDGTQSYRTRQHYEAAVTGLQADGSQLEIVLGMEKWSASVSFDVSRFHLPQPVSAEKPAAADLMRAARARAKALDRKSLNEALQSAAHGNDVAFVKALIEAGADPKKASDVGWTALMVAATYGTADVVDALVEAGSDVNACDHNCGGLSVLMWAATSGREPKRKVQAILKAGANKERTTAGGYDVLMSAASSEDLPTVEWLLQAGLKPSRQDKEGKTALMVACGSEGGNIVRCLIAAGADVNAKDASGMTPLMHAADGVNTADAVKLLLEAGANPAVKDKKGRTALDIGKASNGMGAERVVALLKAVTKK